MTNATLGWARRRLPGCCCWLRFPLHCSRCRYRPRCYWCRHRHRCCCSQSPTERSAICLARSKLMLVKPRSGVASPARQQTVAAAAAAVAATTAAHRRLQQLSPPLHPRLHQQKTVAVGAATAAEEGVPSAIVETPQHAAQATGGTHEAPWYRTPSIPPPLALAGRQLGGFGTASKGYASGLTLCVSTPARECLQALLLLLLRQLPRPHPPRFAGVVEAVAEEAVAAAAAEST